MNQQARRNGPVEHLRPLPEAGSKEPPKLTTAADLAGAPPSVPRPPTPATAPATARHTVRYRLGAWEVTTQFRSPTSQVQRYLDKLAAMGAEPIGSELAASPTAPPETGVAGLPICPRHGVEMESRSAHNDSWFSHVIFDDRGQVVMGKDGKPLHCKGYPAPSSPGYFH